MIEECNFGQIKIKGKIYISDVIIYLDKVDGNWWRKKGHLLLPQDLKAIIKEKPDILVIGTGNSELMKIPPSTKLWIESQGIKLIDAATKKACFIYNQLSESTQVIAALHLTC